MVWQLIRIFCLALWRYFVRRIQWGFRGAWYLHRYRTGLLLLSETEDLCRSGRQKIVAKDRAGAIKKQQKKIAKLKVYAVVDEKENSHVRQNDQEACQEKGS